VFHYRRASVFFGCENNGRFNDNLAVLKAAEAADPSGHDESPG
jgi:hypothetical protein